MSLPPRPARSNTARVLTVVAAVLLAVAAALEERAGRLASVDRRLRAHHRVVAAAVGVCCLFAAGAAYVRSGTATTGPTTIAAAEADTVAVRTDEPTTAALRRNDDGSPSTEAGTTPTSTAKARRAAGRKNPKTAVPRKAQGDDRPAPTTTVAFTPEVAKALAAWTANATRTVVPVRNGAVPTGKGMWIWMPERSEGGNVDAIVRKARDYGLTHIYVRTGSAWKGFEGAAFLDAILPAAHAANIRVYGWDFPSLADYHVDVARAAQAIRYTTPGGHRIDGFVADIERGPQGTHLSPEGALAYGTLLRQEVGWGYPLIACVPKLSGPGTNFPYPHVIAQFDAVAPMVYWLNREPGEDVANTIKYLQQFGKPIIPVGQMYDGGIDGGPSGTPNRMAIHRFMGVAAQWGAAGVSFWDWQEATQEQWDALRDAPWFTLPNDGAFQDSATRSVQAMLRTMGFGGTDSGRWDQPSVDALKAYQQAANLQVTGQWSLTTRRTLLTPFNPPIRPMPH